VGTCSWGVDAFFVMNDEAESFAARTTPELYHAQRYGALLPDGTYAGHPHSQRVMQEINLQGDPS